MLPQLLSELLSGVSHLLSQTKPDISTVESVEQFAQIIGFKSNDVTEILAENSIYRKWFIKNSNFKSTWPITPLRALMICYNYSPSRFY